MVQKSVHSSARIRNSDIHNSLAGKTTLVHKYEDCNCLWELNVIWQHKVLNQAS